MFKIEFLEHFQCFDCFYAFSSRLHCFTSTLSCTKGPLSEWSFFCFLPSGISWEFNTHTEGGEIWSNFFWKEALKALLVQRQHLKFHATDSPQNVFVALAILLNLWSLSLAECPKTLSWVPCECILTFDFQFLIVFIFNFDLVPPRCWVECPVNAALGMSARFWHRRAL